MNKRKEKIFLPILITIILVPLFLGGCTKIPAMLLVIEGNFYNSRGNYGKAISSYIRALEKPEARPYAEYGLGSVYFTMGEEKASLSRFSEATDLLDTISAGRQELGYRIHYNTGVVLFSGGDFSGAADSFREALKKDGKKIEAKRNLELSLLSLARQTPSEQNSDSRENESDSSRDVLYQYIRQKELLQWKNREWPEEELSGPDY